MSVRPCRPRQPRQPCRPRAVRTRGVFTHRDDFGKPACVERGLVRTAMFHGPTDVPRMGAPVMERAGSSGNARIGSHLAATDTAGGHAGQVDGPGSSRNAENGSHLAATDAAKGHAGQVGGPGSSRNAGIGSHLAGWASAMSHGRSCGGGPYRAVQNQASCCTGRPRWTVRYRKRPCGVREAHLSSGSARGGGSGNAKNGHPATKTVCGPVMGSGRARVRGQGQGENGNVDINGW